MTYEEYYKDIEELSIIKTLWARQDIETLLTESANDPDISDKEYDELYRISGFTD